MSLSSAQSISPGKPPSPGHSLNYGAVLPGRPDFSTSPRKGGAKLRLVHF
jgi:hypothetical protein